MGISRSFSELSQDSIRIAARGRHSLASQLLAHINGVHEIALAQAPQGAGGLFFFPHDHGPSGGGVAIPRGNVWSVDTGDGNSWKETLPGGGIWYKIGRDGTIRTATNSTTTPDVSQVAHFLPYASPGIDSQNTNLASNPCAWEIDVLVRVPSGTPKIKIYNRATGTESSEATGSATTSPQWLTVIDVPVRENRFQELDLYIQNSTATEFRILNVAINETRQTSQPASQGTREASVSAPLVAP